MIYVPGGIHGLKREFWAYPNGFSPGSFELALSTLGRGRLDVGRYMMVPKARLELARA